MKTLKITGIFIAGLLIGAVLMNLLHMYVRSTNRGIMQTMLKNEQEALAARASRENDKLESVLHRWSVVQAESQSGFRIFRDNYNFNKSTDESFWWPFYLLSNKFAYSSPKAKSSLEGGSKIVEGIDRGKLATALEAIGEKEKAEKEWQLAQELTHKQSLEETKKLVSKMLEQDNDDLAKEIEKGILGETEKAQHL